MVCRDPRSPRFEMLSFLPTPMATETARNLNESTATPAGSEAVLLILVAASFSHLLNDTIQSLIPAIYPVLKDSFQLSFAQIGLITLTFQVTASLLQPLVGLYTDHRPQLFSLAIGNLYSDRNNLVISIPCHPGLRPRIGSW